MDSAYTPTSLPAGWEARPTAYLNAWLNQANADCDLYDDVLDELTKRDNPRVFYFDALVREV